MDLYNYWGKRVRITDVDGKTHVGYAAYYTSELDDPNGIANLSIEPDNNRERILISFTADEISKIEIISSDTPAMAKAV